MGRLVGDQVECGYDGLTFDATGTRVPRAERIPHRACVRAYPVQERYGLVWVWMGDPAQADPARIFDAPNLDLAIDLGPMRFRQRLRKLMDAENGLVEELSL